MSKLSRDKIETLTRQIAEIRRKADDAKRRRRRKSKLDKYRDEILFMKDAGASLSEIRAWLKQKGSSAARSTVFDALKKWRSSETAANGAIS